MYRICHVITDKNIGGAGIWLLGFLNNYNRKLYKVSVILPEDSMLAERITNPEILVHKLPMKESSIDMAAIAPIRSIIKQDQIQLLHTHASLSARIAGRLSGIPIIYTKHCLDEGTPTLKSRLMARLGAVLCNKVIAVSQATYDNLCKQGVPASKIVIIPNGIRPIPEYSTEEKEIARNQYGLSESDTIIGILGRLETIKGHEYLFRSIPEVLSRFPHVKIMVVGKGSLEAELRAQCTSLGILDHVIFTGFVDDPASVLNLFDVNICTSLSESFSLSVGEAMSVGVVTIATRCGGPEELIEDGKDGFLIPLKDEAAIAEKIEYLLEHVSEKEKMATLAKNKIKEKYDLSIVTAQLEEEYSQMLQKK